MKFFNSILTLLFLSFTTLVVGQDIFSPISLDLQSLSVKDQGLYSKIQSNLEADFVKIVEVTPLSEFTNVDRITIELPLLLINKDYHLKYVYSPSDEEYFWYGESDDNRNSFEILYKDGAYSGGFSLGSDYFEINPLTDNRVIISRTIEATGIIINHPELHNHPDESESTGADKNLQTQNRTICEDPDDIRVLVFYTPNVKSTYTTRQINGKATQSVANLNTAVSNSEGNFNDVFFKMATAAPVELTNFVEHHDNIGNDLTEFASRVGTFTGPGSNSTILRDAMGADLCILLTECAYTDGGGQFLGFTRVPQILAGDDQRAFSIVDYASATHTKHRTFTHEVSHLFGGGHFTNNISGTFTQDFAQSVNPCVPCPTQPFVTRHEFPSVTHEFAGNAAFVQVHHQLRFSREGTTLDNGAEYGFSISDNFEQIIDRAPQVRNYRIFNDYEVRVQGIDYANENTNYTWTSFVCGCTSSKTYLWERSDDGINFYTVSYSSTYSGMVANDSDMYLRLTVTCGGQSETDLFHITNLDNGNCNPCPLEHIDDTTIDLEESYIPQRVTLFPNPPTNVLNVDFDNEVTGPVQIRVVSSAGNKILQKRFNTNRSKSITLNTKSYDTGLYYLVVNINGKIVTKSFLINRI